VLSSKAIKKDDFFLAFLGAGRDMHAWKQDTIRSATTTNEIMKCAMRADQ
jgi:hypothetical protein